MGVIARTVIALRGGLRRIGAFLKSDWFAVIGFGLCIMLAQLWVNEFGRISAECATEPSEMLSLKMDRQESLIREIGVDISRLRYEATSARAGVPIEDFDNSEIEVSKKRTEAAFLRLKDSYEKLKLACNDIGDWYDQSLIFAALAGVLFAMASVQLGRNISKPKSKSRSKPKPKNVPLLPEKE